MAEDSEVETVESWEDLIKDEPKDEPKDGSNSKPNNKSSSKKKNKSKDGSKSKVQNSSGNELNDRFNSLYLGDSMHKQDATRTIPETNSYSSVLNKNLPASSIKILNRSAATASPASNSSLQNTANGAVIIDGLSTTQNPYKITFEDNTRTQFIPQAQQNTKVKILQRPKAESKNDPNDPNGLVKNGFFNAKTIQEREAEYARARARILGVNYENDQAELPSSQPQTTNGRPQNNQQGNKRNDINLVRTPAGPSGGQAGFAQRR